MYRGTPVIYVDYTDYDEIAHHSGPERAESLDALDGVDATLASLEKAARDAPRPQAGRTLDHGAGPRTAPFRGGSRKPIAEVISRLMSGTDVTVVAGPSETYGSLNAAVAEAAQAPGATGAMARSAFRGPRTGRWTSRRDDRAASGPRHRTRRQSRAGRRAVRKPRAGVVPADQRAGDAGTTGRAVAAPGPWSCRAPRRRAGDGPLVGARRGGGVWCIGDGLSRRRADRGRGPVGAGHGEYAAESLRRLDEMLECGDLVLISMLDTSTDESTAFEELIAPTAGWADRRRSRCCSTPRTGRSTSRWWAPRRCTGSSLAGLGGHRAGNTGGRQQRPRLARRLRSTPLASPRRRWTPGRSRPEPTGRARCTGYGSKVEGRPLDDTELIERARRGDVMAYEELVRRYRDVAVRTATVVGGADDAEDATQEAFVKAYAALGRFGPARRSSLVAPDRANEARNRRRSAGRRASLAVRAAEDRPSDGAAPSPEAAVLDHERRATLAPRCPACATRTARSSAPATYWTSPRPRRPRPSACRRAP